MTLFLKLAAEVIDDPTWWNPYLKGALVAILSIALFVGAAYLLLYTNVGSRLGFLVTAAAFTGFMAVLSLFWITGQFPNGPVGPAPGWIVEDLVADPGQSRIDRVQDITDVGEPASEEVIGQVRADLDVELTNREGPFGVFAQPAEFLDVQTLALGGGRKWPMFWSERTLYAATEICPVLEVEVLPLDPPPTPECDPGEPTLWAISIHDLGARRLPSWMFFGGSSLLFALTLLSLHRYEIEVEQGGMTGSTSGDGDSGGDGDAPSGNGAGERETEPAGV